MRALRDLQALADCMDRKNNKVRNVGAIGMYSIVRMLGRLALLCCVSSIAFGGTRGVILTNSGGFGDAVIEAAAPSSAPYTDSGNEWLLIRTSNHGALGNRNDIVWWHSCLRVSWETDGRLRVGDTCDGSDSAAVGFDVSSYTDDDIIIVVQRDMTNRTFTVEVWPGDLDVSQYKIANTGFGVGTDVNTRVGSLEVGGEFASGDADYICWDSTLRTPNKYTPYTDTNSTCDLGEWKFQDSLADSSGNGLNMTASSGPTYTDTLLYDPWVSVLPQSIKVGEAQSMTGKCLPLDGATTATKLWTQIDMLPALTLTTDTTETVTINGQTDSRVALESYQLQLSCTQANAANTTASAKLGAVPVVQYGSTFNVTQSAASIWFLGRLSFGATGYGYYDNGAGVAISYMGDNIVTNPTNQPALGAALGPSGDCDITATGTLRIQCDNSWTSGLVADQNIFMEWVTSPTGTAIGKYQFPVGSVINGTTLDGKYGAESRVCGSAPCNNIGAGMYDRKAQTSTFLWQWWGYDGASNDNWNYYDYAIGAYSMWESTGLDNYLNYARTMGDLWFTWANDHGAYWPEPRVRSLRGVMYYLIETGQDSTWWAFLEPMLEDGWTRWDASADATEFHNDDKREIAYQLMNVADAARWDPDSGRHATYCGVLDTQMGRMHNGIIPLDADNAYYSENAFTSTEFYVTYPDGDGNSPWRSSLIGISLLLSSDLFLDQTSSGCYSTDMTLGANLLEDARLLGNWIYNYGTFDVGAGIRGIYYNSGYHAAAGYGTTAGIGTIATTGTTTIVGTGTAWQGSTGVVNTLGTTVTWVSGDPLDRAMKGMMVTINGVGYSVIGMPGNPGDGTPATMTLATSAGTQTGVTYSFDPGFDDGTWYIGIANPTPALRETYRIVSCSSDVSCTVDHATVATGTGFTYTKAPQAQTMCGNDASYCEQDCCSTTGLDRTTPGLMAALAYRLNSDTFKGYAQALFKGAFSGPASGPGYFDACSSPMGSSGTCNPTYSDLYSVLPACASSDGTEGRTLPCLPGGTQYIHSGKDMNEGIGVTWGIAMNGFLNAMEDIVTNAGVALRGNVSFGGNVVIQ
jgi:hypothetical protein